MSQVTSPVILDSTGQDIVTQLAAISAAIAAGTVITSNTNTTLAGVLQGSNGKVAVKPVDASPTADSTNLVSSGGVKTALDGKAAKADLTNIQATGTTNTTGAAIPAGAYFYLNGVLHQAKTQIDQNATFTVNTNCEVVTGGGINDLFGKKATVLFGTTGTSSETLAVSAGRFLIILATRGDTSFTFAVVYRYNSWKLEGTNTAGVTVDANTGQITLLNYTHYKIIY